MTDTPTSAHLTRDSAFKTAINGWKIYLEDQGKSPHTVKAFAADVRLLAKFLPPAQTLGATTTDQINQFLDWMQHERGVPCSPKTLARRITSIKAFFRWLQAGGVVFVDPAEKVVQHSVISPLPEVLTPAELDLALAAADQFRTGDARDHRPYTLLLLLISTGIKKSETLALQKDHIDLEAPEGPTLFVRYASPQHRYKERKIALPTEWVEAYQAYVLANDVTDRVFPWSPRRLEYLLEDISEAAGLTKHISFAMCRWTCALVDLRAGEDPNRIRQKLGVSKIQWREIQMKLNRLSESTPA